MRKSDKEDLLRDISDDLRLSKDRIDRRRMALQIKAQIAAARQLQVAAQEARARGPMRRKPTDEWSW